ncbi:hypothetical protein ANACOL_01613 [Anaerotruncus colihominis DSM 17241]|uniref:Uncharacterized protein n=1 Tax=Anaerotruncus colihominis DSM 17241 TaxID=445972 RepID=B0PA44_9FIRM|nr:hypothetical protein ANACOL_01613 [Anaerotruncus colihominis DSM 17241]
MLMAGEQQVEIKLAGNFTGDIFPAVRQKPSALQFLLEAAVIDAHTYIADPLQTGQSCPGRLKRVGDAHPLKILRLLPYVHKIGNHAGDAHTQAIGERMDSILLERQSTVQILHVGAETNAVHGVEILSENVVAKIEIVISKGEIVYAHSIKGCGGGMNRPMLPMLQIILCKGRTLERIAAIQNEGIFVLLNLRGQI